ncbi:MAG: nitroreductase family protein [Nanoarchaeota archaeon]|nr:nitroreductase family protein [Nanoarchaeota archaeon]MCG2718803.1 nitroreductase family protein [Nanoarchaeota archaeon]
MELKEAIKNRRSIRNYQPDKPVAHDLIADIIDTARYAPSSGNLQNWKVIIISDAEKKDRLATACLRQKWMVNASAILVVCNNIADVKRLYKERGEFLYSIQNIAGFTQNILLTAHSLGLATCWVGAFDPDAVKRVLRIPEGVEPEAIVALGYGIEEVDVPPRKTVDQICFFEVWGSGEKGFGAFPLEKHTEKVGQVQQKSKSLFGKIFSKFSKKE